MNYKISMSIVTGKDEHGRDFYEMGACGDFRVTKHFVVTDLKNLRERPNGWIVQYIIKKTEVTHNCGNKWDKTTKETKLSSMCERSATEKTLTTSEDIETFTSGNVKYMTHDYLELFEIKDGNSTYNDAFQNGAVTKYIWEEDESTKKFNWSPIIEDEIHGFYTKGVIRMIGTSIFIPSTTNVKERFKWNTKKTTPANGLPYLPATPGNVREIFALRQSEPLVHDIRITWGYPEKSGKRGIKSTLHTFSPRDGESIMPKDVANSIPLTAAASAGAAAGAGSGAAAAGAGKSSGGAVLTRTKSNRFTRNKKRNKTRKNKSSGEN